MTKQAEELELKTKQLSDATSRELREVSAFDSSFSTLNRRSAAQSTDAKVKALGESAEAKFKMAAEYDSRCA